MELDKIWEYFTENGIATEEELQLVTDINGYNIESLNDILFIRTEYRSIEQYLEFEDEETYLEYYSNEDNESEVE